MTPDERLKNALIYGTSHPEAYMTKAEALKEYGEAVRRQAVGACKELEDKRHGNAHNFACEDCAAAIETMKLP